MKNGSKSFIVIGLLVIGLVWLLNHPPTKGAGNSTPFFDRFSGGCSSGWSNHTTQQDITITISKKKSATFKVVGDFSVTVEDSDVSYICHFNEADNGGKVVTVTARNRRSPNWETKAYPDNLSTVSFVLPRGSKFDSAVLKCTGIR